MDFELSERSEALRQELQSFFDREVLPRHETLEDLFVREAINADS